MRCARETVREAAFANMLRHINVIFFTLPEWELLFGTVSAAEPYGSNFWPGFRQFMISCYRPSLRTSRWISQATPLTCYFETPARFSKANARCQKSESNQGTGSYYPAFCWPIDDNTVVMVCLHIALHRSSPWTVNSTWIQLLERDERDRDERPDERPSTVVIEEVDSDSDSTSEPAEALYDDWVEV